MASNVIINNGGAKGRPMIVFVGAISVSGGSEGLGQEHRHPAFRPFPNGP
jgi:hypothetical protein